MTFPFHLTMSQSHILMTFTFPFGSLVAEDSSGDAAGKMSAFKLEGLGALQ